MKCKIVREKFQKDEEKHQKYIPSDEFSAVMGTFSVRWREFWNEVSVITIIHLLASHLESLNKLGPLPSFIYYRLRFFFSPKYSHPGLDFPGFHPFHSALDLHSYKYINIKSFFRLLLC